MLGLSKQGCPSGARKWQYLVGAALFATAFMSAAPASASGLDLGTAADYAVVDLGSGTTFGWNVPVTGNMLLGNDVTANFAGGASIGGTIYYDSSTQGQSTFKQVANCNPASLCSSQVTGPGSNTVTGDALASAQNVSNYAAGLTANQTFTNITSATTFAASGAQTVIDVSSISNAAITISGTANDIFVINVSGSYNTNVSMILKGGVTASDILWNLTGTGGMHVLQTSGGDCGGKTCLYGTFLATKGGAYQFSNLNLTGELIITDGDMQLVSGSQVTFTPFMNQVPEPATIALFGSALLGLGGLSFMRRRKSNS